MDLFIGLNIFLLFMVIGLFILWIWALVDIIVSKFQDTIMQVVWLLVVFFLPVIGVILYLLVGRSTKRVSDFTSEERNQKYDQLSKLKKLLDEGVISQDEFESEKEKILNR